MTHTAPPGATLQQLLKKRETSQGEGWSNAGCAKRDAAHKDLPHFGTWLSPVPVPG